MTFVYSSNWNNFARLVWGTNCQVKQRTVGTEKLVSPRTHVAQKIICLTRVRGRTKWFSTEKQPKILHLALYVEGWKCVCVCVTVKLQFKFYTYQANVEKQRRSFLLHIETLWWGPCQRGNVNWRVSWWEASMYRMINKSLSYIWCVFRTSWKRKFKQFCLRMFPSYSFLQRKYCIIFVKVQKV
jgi:hypothetical protein